VCEPDYQFNISMEGPVIECETQICGPTPIEPDRNATNQAYKGRRALHMDRKQRPAHARTANVILTGLEPTHAQPVNKALQHEQSHCVSQIETQSKTTAPRTHTRTAHTRMICPKMGNSFIMGVCLSMNFDSIHFTNIQ
jgi:hypothetical protein